MGRRDLSHVLLDTHVWAWSLTAKQRLSTAAIAAIDAAETVSISAISLYEIGQKVRLGKWPEMAPSVLALTGIAQRQGLHMLDVSPQICLNAAVLRWDHRDPFDRIIGVTAQMESLVLVSADAAFDELSMFGWTGRVW